MRVVAAGPGDAPALAHLINLAGEGIPAYLWDVAREPGETAMEFGARRAAREEGGFSYRHARVCRDAATDEGMVLGMVLAYRLPDPYDTGDLTDLPAVVRPMVELESQAPGSWYVNALATLESHRGRGVGTRLMADTRQRAAEAGCERMSIIVASTNRQARALYERLGFSAVARRPVVDYPGSTHGGDWVLMTASV